MDFLLPEWAPHEAVWIGFPSDPQLWLADLKEAEREVATFAEAVHAGGRGEKVILVAAHDDAAKAARDIAPFAEVIVENFGDIWLRDTGPIVLGSGDGRSAACFHFNGWGGKYELEGDQDVGERLARRAGFDFTKADWILEGGAIDHDGSGTVITTEQCLLNPNRNPGMSRAEIERRLRQDLGFERVVWLGEGLLGDHTDGHVDNLARFVAPNRVALPRAEANDPNAAVYADATKRLEAAGIEVAAIPSPGLLESEGDIIPASYMNFYIGNAAVVVPLYGAPNDEAAVQAVQLLFPDRAAVGLRADHVLTGGGSFHCISQQIPA